MAKPRALLTGRSGFTGRYVTCELEQAGYEVFGLSNHGEGGALGSIRADLLDREAMRLAVEAVRPDVVLHLAAIAFVAHGDVDEMYRVNVVGTRNLLEALAASSKKPEVVILASSANIYGNAKVEPITEDTPPAPANDYAVSKLAMEYMARLWMDKLPIVITRPFNYTGVGQSEQFLIPKIVAHFKRRDQTIELGNTDVIRDFSDVRDVARSYRRIAEKKPVGQIFNLCGGVGHSLDDVIAMMVDIAGYQITKQINPAFVRANEVHRLVGSNSRFRSAMNLQTTIPLNETLAWMYSGD
ncbi:GDP-mannose 4,6-dehydratase [Frateuria sp. MAH-13]|uniref:GDP-mannose 4,6-dehydratase n=1 Tax=Frateuria flava TaxID=2821489 RepID=A0ABS4DQZ8_9GAMM|nr:NAD-dependent epimerase/dehydratase family protein [Frateuria flava]MBP1475465.1 GDP-mannose 4,6-dehydratase [Frateuria flava]